MEGIEPPTGDLTGRCNYRLCYIPKKYAEKIRKFPHILKIYGMKPHYSLLKIFLM